MPNKSTSFLGLCLFALAATAQCRSTISSVQSERAVKEATATWSWKSFLSPRSEDLQRRQLTTDAQGNVGIAFAQNTPSCQDGQTNQENSCWAQLGLSNYVRDWVSKNKCGDEGFTKCFFKANSFSGLDCGTVNNENCVSPQPGKWGPNVFYVIYAMYSINQYMSDYWIVVDDSLATAKANFGNVTDILDVSDNSTLTGEISTAADLLSDQIKSQINTTLDTIGRDATQFIRFAELGKFTTRKKIPLDAGTNIQRIFNTYQISLALNRSDIIAVAAKDTNPNQLATNGSTLAYPLGDCKAGYDADGVCDAWYFSQNTSTAFALNSLRNISADYASTLSTLFQNNATNGTALFDDTASCQANNTGLNVTIDWTGLTIECASQLSVYEWAKQCDDTDKGCEFANEKPNQDGFWQVVSASAGNSGPGAGTSASSNSTVKRLVPPGFLGPEIVAGNGKVSIARELGKGNATVATASLQAGTNRTLSDGG